MVDQILLNPIPQQHDYCLDAKTPDLVSHLSLLQTKHASDKEKFLKTTIHSRKVCDGFIRILQKCPIQKEYRIKKEQEIRKQMDISEQRQKESLQIINGKTKFIEQCQRAVMIRKLAKDVSFFLNSEAREGSRDSGLEWHRAHQNQTRFNTGFCDYSQNFFSIFKRLDLAPNFELGIQNPQNFTFLEETEFFE